MRLDIQSRNRLGITQEILAVFASHRIDVRKVDMFTHHTFVDVPSFEIESLPRVEADLLEIPGVTGVQPTDMLPSERGQAQLQAVLSAMEDAVIAIGKDGTILLANRQANRMLGHSPDDDLTGTTLSSCIQHQLVERVLASHFAIPEQEVEVGEDSYLLHTTPFRLDPSDDENEEVRGGILIFQTRSQLGKIITALNRKDTEGFDAILGSSSIILEVKERAQRLAGIDAPLLILGETGTGKEMFARACHAASLRAQRPFLALNCASLPEDLAESELFGYEGGAFTSASRGGKPGLFELADSGTVFLDEIGELTPYLQAKLLRFMQDGSFMRIGGKSERKVDVRIIAATNRDLARMADAGEFRSDLLFRMNVLTIQTPALRDRTEDIPELAKAFVARSVARIGRGPVRLTPEAIERLQAAPWPGNVRELENVVFRSVSLSDSDVISAGDLIFDTSGPSSRVMTEQRLETSLGYSEAFAEFESLYFKRLASSGLTSRKLVEPTGLSHATIARKLARYCR